MLSRANWWKSRRRDGWYALGCSLHCYTPVLEAWDSKVCLPHLLTCQVSSVLKDCDGWQAAKDEMLVRC